MAKNVLLIGVGGVGSIVAYGIDFTGKADISVVVRRDFEKVSKVGYELKSIDYGDIKGWKPKHIYPSVEAAAKDVPVYDFVVITTKNLPDVVKPEELAEPAITPEKTTVVLIQNGFDIGRPFIEKYPNNFCLSGVSHIGSHNNNGVVTQTQHDECLISYFINPNLAIEDQKRKAEEFISIYSNEKNAVTYFPDAKWYRYRKLVYNASLNTVCALTGVDTGRLDLAGTLESVSIPAMREVIKVAKADGVTLPADIINTVVHSDDGDWFEPSMRVDVKKGNPIELEAILGNLLRVAKELNVETPYLQILYNLLKAVQFRLKEGKGMNNLPEKRPISDKVYS
ncbi:DEKNAAC104636 [Brettanomyces naardenensis]|uniref:2-dehydropantoate 2-reductase n=1 Tax=Brettanomyces naardenensis TaxID=13370 RepID=A0A448YRP2_BRENA|nr:DEKNAAC104636 [Brettanomyces naardenensis]